MAAVAFGIVQSERPRELRRGDRQRHRRSRPEAREISDAARRVPRAGGGRGAGGRDRRGRPSAQGRRRCCRRSRSRRRSSASASTIRTAAPSTKTAACRRRNIRTCSCASRPRWSATSSRSCGRRSRSKFDYEGEIVLVIGKEGRHIPQDKALSYHRRADARQRRQRARLAAPRHAQRHPGQEFRQLRQPRSLDRAGRRRRSRQAAARHDQGQRRAAAGRHHRPPDLGLRLADQLHLHLRDAASPAT